MVKKRPPKCKVCHFEHWSYEGHKLMGGPEPPKDVERLVRGVNSRKVVDGRVDPMVRGETITVQLAGPAGVDLAHAYDGIGPLTRESARSLTDRLRVEIESLGRQTEAVGRALELAQRRQAWRSLGYASWEDYVEQEFGVSRSRGAQLLSHHRFVETLPEGATDSTVTSGNTLTERETRAVRSDPKKVARVKRAVAQGVAPAEAVRRAALPAKATSRTRDPATGQSCDHEPVTVVVCKNCGRRLE